MLTNSGPYAFTGGLLVAYPDETPSAALRRMSVRVDEMTIEDNAPCADKRVRDVAWPRESVVASVRRGRQVTVPYGDTLLRPGDVLVLVAEGEARDALRRLCQQAAAR